MNPHRDIRALGAAKQYAADCEMELHEFDDNIVVHRHVHRIDKPIIRASRKAVQPTRKSSAARSWKITRQAGISSVVGAFVLGILSSIFAVAVSANPAICKGDGHYCTASIISAIHSKDRREFLKQMCFISPSQLDGYHTDGKTPLMHAAGTGNSRFIREMIRGIDRDSMLGVKCIGAKANPILTDHHGRGSRTARAFVNGDMANERLLYNAEWEYGKVKPIRNRVSCNAHTMKTAIHDRAIDNAVWLIDGCKASKSGRWVTLAMGRTQPSTLVVDAIVDAGGAVELQHLTSAVRRVMQYKFIHNLNRHYAGSTSSLRSVAKGVETTLTWKDAHGADWSGVWDGEARKIAKLLHLFKSAPVVEPVAAASVEEVPGVELPPAAVQGDVGGSAGTSKTPEEQACEAIDNMINSRHENKTPDVELEGDAKCENKPMLHFVWDIPYRNWDSDGDDASTKAKQEMMRRKAIIPWLVKSGVSPEEKANVCTRSNWRGFCTQYSFITFADRLKCGAAPSYLSKHGSDPSCSYIRQGMADRSKPQVQVRPVADASSFIGYQGATQSFTVKLDVAPSSNEVVEFQLIGVKADATREVLDATFDPATLTFTSSNYDVAQSVSISYPSEMTGYVHAKIEVSVKDAGYESGKISIPVITAGLPHCNVVDGKGYQGRCHDTFAGGSNGRLIPSVNRAGYNYISMGDKILMRRYGMEAPDGSFITKSEESSVTQGAYLRSVELRCANATCQVAAICIISKSDGSVDIGFWDRPADAGEYNMSDNGVGKDVSSSVVTFRDLGSGYDGAGFSCQFISSKEFEGMLVSTRAVRDSK